MDMYALLQQGHNKEITKQITDYIGNNQKRFDALMQLFLSDEMRMSQRASWPLGDSSINYPELFDKHHRTLIDSLKKKQKHNAIKRNVLRTYQFAKIPEEYEAELYDICLNFMLDPEEMTASKAFGMRVCERVVEKYPEMANEVLEVIKANIEHWSSGLKGRGKKFLLRWA